VDEDNMHAYYPTDRGDGRVGSDTGDDDVEKDWLVVPRLELSPPLRDRYAGQLSTRPKICLSRSGHIWTKRIAEAPENSGRSPEEPFHPGEVLLEEFVEPESADEGAPR
jgi:hypothetical protein